MFIKIKQGGFLSADDKHNNSLQMYELHSPCKIDHGVVLKDILLLAQPLAQQLSPLLTGSSDWLNEIIDEGLDNAFDPTENIQHLELSWRSSISKYSTHTPYLNLSTDFYGVGNNETYAIEMLPVYKLTQIPVILNPMFNIIDERTGITSTSSLANVQKEFTLFEILFGIFWELTFFGGVKNRDTEKEKLHNIVKKLKDTLDEL